MKDTQQKDVRPQDRGDAFVIQEQGAITRLTNGSAVEYPWFESGPPPFNHWCPIC